MTSPEEEQEYTQEQIIQITKEIMECDYYRSKDVTEADMKDFLAKEKSGENIFSDSTSVDSIDERMRLGEEMFIDEMSKRFTKNLKDHGIMPSVKTQIDTNEEISLFRIKQYASMIKEMKAEFQVNKYRLINTFKDEKAFKTYTGDQIENAVLYIWHSKDCIDKMEKELREWEEEVKQRYNDNRDFPNL